MPTKDRAAIYEYILEEGVMVAKKDLFAPKHMVLGTSVLMVEFFCSVVTFHFLPRYASFVLQIQKNLSSAFHR